MSDDKLKEDVIEQLNGFREKLMAQVQEVDNSIERLKKAEGHIEIMTALANNMNTMVNLANK